MTGEEPPRASAGSPRYRRALIALFCAGIATFAQVYSPQALLPDIARDFHVSESASSLAIGATTIGMAIGMLPWGRLSDRIGRMQAMRWALLLAVITGLVTPFMPTIELFVAVRFVEGFMLAGLPAIAVTALAETVTPSALGGAVGAFIAGNSMGGLAARILAAGFSDHFDWRGGLFAVGIVSVIAAALFLWFMPQTTTPASPGLPILRATIENLRNPGVMVMVAQAFLLMGGFVAAYNYLSFRLQDAPFGLSLSQISWLYVAYIAGALASRNAWGLTRRLSPTGVLLLSSATILAGLGLTLLSSLIAIVVGLVLFTVGFFSAHTIALSLVSRRATPGGKSLSPSLYNLAYYSGSSLLGWVGGLAFAAGGWVGNAAMITGVTVLAMVLAWVHAARNGGLMAVDRRS